MSSVEKSLAFSRRNRPGTKAEVGSSKEMHLRKHVFVRLKVFKRVGFGFIFII